MSQFDKPSNPSRRNVIKTVAATTAAIAMPAIWTSSKAASKRIVIRDSGGIYSKVYGDVFYKPFTKATGIEVVGVPSNAEPTAQIRTMVDTGNYTWDMASISQPAIELLTTGKQYLEKHNLDADPVIAGIPATFRSAYGVGTNVYTTVLAYRTDAFKGRKAPTSWKDMWNVAEFPGRRCLRKHPFDTIEEALMADGVPGGAVYPCDVNRAFKSLDKIKPHIDVWWTGGAQVEQMLKSGEIDMVATWISRPQAAIAAGAPVSICWDQHLWGVDNWTILKGSPNAEACRQFIKFASDPKRQAALTPFLAAGVTHPDAFKYIDPKIAQTLPTYPDNLRRGVKISADYWLKNQDVALEKFNAWLLK
ncbi:Spermidine/putrescine-binding periplasmic protein [Pandoraea terrae]|uniref:Spermidine/putrescine-binding periplasmic protein n=1 Tax=Pandoraea terrae TaxID=1537710 RepID=A0A5E4TU57_9BURK|nr:ABC transporter substrate-binding protein [Pandoraea terrae]VVD91141.1 Spermidine/putrescine-binding periplasmic protein [Pandoraea terrae]